MHRLWWVRNDFRLADNIALQAACSCLDESTQVHALYLVCRQQWLLHDMGPIQVVYIEQNLNVLKSALAKLGIQLHVRYADNFSECITRLQEFCVEYSIDTVHANTDPEINEVQRDSSAYRVLSEQNVELQLHLGFGHFDSHAVRTLKGDVFKVFTPYRTAFLRLLAEDPESLYPICAPEALATSTVVDTDVITFDWLADYSGSLPECTHTAEQVRELVTQFPIGELQASALLHEFTHSQLTTYGQNRDFPAISATSTLSSALAFGLLSFRQCVVVAQQVNPRILQSKEQPGFMWISELIWREFYRYLLVELPSLCQGKNFNTKADKVEWRNNQQEFKRWCEGKTGYPIVDAAMRQLVQTGWMHNRLRMIVASFLTKHLLIDWRWGERFFRQHLIDGDLAANNGGWQWAASTGCDGQPYFRVFNPITQSERFDPTTAFLCQYIPELEKLPLKKRHFPDGEGYVAPIVDHKAARARAISAFERVMKK